MIVISGGGGGGDRDDDSSHGGKLWDISRLGVTLQWIVCKNSYSIHTLIPSTQIAPNSLPCFI